MFGFLKRKKRMEYPEEWRIACEGLETQPGGWVVFQSRLTTGDIQQVMRLALMETPDVEGASQEEILEATLAFLEEVGRILGPLVLDWNWVDETGQEMPLITEDLEVMTRLDIRELHWLIGQMQERVGKMRALAVPPVKGGGSSPGRKGSGRRRQSGP